MDIIFELAIRRSLPSGVAKYSLKMIKFTFVLLFTPETKYKLYFYIFNGALHSNTSPLNTVIFLIADMNSRAQNAHQQTEWNINCVIKRLKSNMYILKIKKKTPGEWKRPRMEILFFISEIRLKIETAPSLGRIS